MTRVQWQSRLSCLRDFKYLARLLIQAIVSSRLAPRVPVVASEKKKSLRWWPADDERFLYRPKMGGPPQWRFSAVLLADIDFRCQLSAQLWARPGALLVALD